MLKLACCSLHCNKGSVITMLFSANCCCVYWFANLALCESSSIMQAMVTPQADSACMRSACCKMLPRARKVKHWG